MRVDECRKVAVVLFNLGAPDRPAAIRPFLLNLFRDPAILRMPSLLRALVARLIARRRLAPARANYALLNGSSPLLAMTRAQADALRTALPDLQVRCFIAMRYWHPFSDAAAQAVRAWRAHEVVLLPLYPEFSTTTTGSSMVAWHDAAAKAGLVAATHTICCYATDPAFIAATLALLRTAHARARVALPSNVPLRVLLSAHGLPESIVAAGDPYQWQIEQTVAAVLAAWGEPALDAVICYQSRATPQRWIEPSTIAEIERAARDGVAVLVVPIAFVSEHSETLVELDIEYRHLADRLHLPGYFVAPAQGTDPAFIAALAAGVNRALRYGVGVHSHGGPRICPRRFVGCPCRAMGAAPVMMGNRDSWSNGGDG